MDQWSQHYGTVHDASGDDDVRSLVQRRRDGKGTEISVGADDVFREGSTSKHVAMPGGPQLLHPCAQIVALDIGNGKGKTLLIDHALQRGGQPRRIDATCVGDHLHALSRDLAQMRSDMDGQEISAKSGSRIGGLHPAENAHRTFGQIIEDQIVKPPAIQQLRY